jgi:hypothetical protein
VLAEVMSGKKLQDVLKAFMDSPSGDVQAVVDALEAAAPKQEERDKLGNYYFKTSNLYLTHCICS